MLESERASDRGVWRIRVCSDSRESSSIDNYTEVASTSETVVSTEQNGTEQNRREAVCRREIDCIIIIIISSN